jgi:hypothetical protein
MPKKIEISLIRVGQFNKMADLLRTIRTYDVRKQVAELKRQGFTKEEAYKLVIDALQNIARESRGIAEIRL